LSTRMVPQGQVDHIEYLVYVDPLVYHDIPDPVRRQEVARVVGRLNKALEGHDFILLGPGRWGSANPQLGVPVGYADIFNARALVELAVKKGDITPEPSYGTHFFQDLVEARIFPLAVYPDDPDGYLNREFLDRAQNRLAELLPDDAGLADCVQVICVPDESGGDYFELAMDGETAMAYFSQAARKAPSGRPEKSQPEPEEPQNPFLGW